MIEEFRRTGRIDLACQFAGCDRSAHYRWLKDEPAYAAEFEAAREQVAGLLEDEAVRRAYQGTAKPMNIGGNIVMVWEFSDTLLMFLLKCRNRKVFGDRSQLDQRFVDAEGKDRSLELGAVRQYMKASEDPAEQE